MEASSQFYQTLLQSGVQVVGQHMPGVASAAIGILAGAGARDEQPDQAGISHFVEHMLFRGTQHLSDRELLERFDAMGISYDASAGIESTVVSAMMIGDRLPAAVDLLTDVVRFPAFPEEALESVRALQLQEVRQREDQPAQKVMDLLRRRMFAGSPIGNDVLGGDETINALSRNALIQYWNDRYTANNMLISVAGNFDWQSLIPQLETVTAAWPAGRGRLILPQPEPETGQVVVQRDMAQEHIGIAFPAVPVSDPHYYAVSLVAQVLGGSMTSRLFQEVREKRGLAYAVQARFDALERAGLVRIYVGTSAERAHESVEVVLEQLGILEEGGVTEDELRLAKIKLKSQLVMRSESTYARMGANLRSWWFEQELRSLETIRDLIDHVTTEEILSVLRALQVNRNLTLAAVGPRSEQELFGGVLAGA